MNQFQNEILKFNVSDFAKSAKTHTLNGARISLEISEEESDTKLSLNILCCVMLLKQHLRRLYRLCRITEEFETDYMEALEEYAGKRREYEEEGF